MDAVRSSSVYPPVISRTLSPGNKEMCLSYFQMQNIGLISDFRGFQEESIVNCVIFTFSASFL